MINKIEEISDENQKKSVNKSEIESEINENNNLINILKNKLKISEEKIKKTLIEQNQEVCKIQNRLDNELEKHKKFSLEKLISEFLPIIDNIERAFDLMKKKEEQKYIEILKNIEQIFSLLKSIFNEFKIFKIDDTNITFNPDIHQAISIQYTNEIDSNKIIEVMQSGYIIDNSRLLRPAMVIVSKNKSSNS